MEFKNGYKLIYQKAKELYASKKPIPMADDAVIDTGLTEEEKSKLKLVYETKDSIIVNFTGLPTAEDKPIVLTADGEPVVGPSGDEPTPITMVPFEVGQKIVGFYFGNVKNGDINEELESLLLAAPAMYEKETVFVGGDNKETGFGALMLYHIVDEEIGDLAFVGYSANGSGMPTVLYSTRDVDFEGIQLTRGYQNLTNGCYNCPTFVAEYVSYNIEDTSWNGNFIGAIEYKPGPTPPATLTKFTMEQAIKGFDFGNVNNGDANSALDSFLLGLPGSMEPTPLITGIGDVMLMATHIVYPSEGIDAGVLYGTDFDHDTGKDIVFYYSTSSFEMEGYSIGKGYQNLTNGKYSYLDPNSYSNVKSIRDDEALWNGIYAGADKYEGPIDDGSDDGSSSSSDSSEPTPNIQPFVDGADWKEGSRIWFNPNADWESLLVTALDRGTTDSGSDITINSLFEISSADPGNDISCPYFSKASLGEGTDAYIIQAYETDADEDDPALIKYCSIAVPQYEVVQGFQNLDSDNAYTPLNYGTNRTIHINPNVDQLGIDWNGTMIGIIEE